MVMVDNESKIRHGLFNTLLRLCGAEESSIKDQFRPISGQRGAANKLFRASSYHLNNIISSTHDLVTRSKRWQKLIVMGMTIQFPNWTLNYQVAAVGAYATILVESIYLILGGFENTSLLSISILTNASAVLFAGFGNASSTPLATIRICLTSLFLLWAIIFRENEPVNGTYAILCSVAHLFYQLRLRHNDDCFEGFLPQHEKLSKTDETPSKSCGHAPPMDRNEAATFSRNLRIFFGDFLCLEGAMLPISILGTVMTYRVFDFDLGFGLVFAFLSAFLSSGILMFINYARTRGRRMQTQKVLQRLKTLMVFFGIFCFVFFTSLDSVEFFDIEFSWWRIAFGVAWFLFLFWTTYVACRFAIHATLFSCASCSQRETGSYGPLTQEDSARCIWDDYETLPALSEDMDGTLGQSTTFWIRRQKGPDLVERFWLNDQEWFQISPRCFVICFVSYVALGSISGGVLNSTGIFAEIGSHVSKYLAFYVTMTFTFVSTGHTLVGDSPELMFVPLRHMFPDWKATTRAVIATMLVHAYLVLVPHSAVQLSLVTPLACTFIASLLLAGLSNPLDSRDLERSLAVSVEEHTIDMGSDGSLPPCTKAWTIDSAMVYSSSILRCLDLRVLLLGLFVTIFDVLCNRHQDEMSVAGWPKGAVISMFVTVIWLYLENTVPTSREIEPGLLSLATVALVGIFSHVNFLGAFGLYDDDWEVQNPTYPMPFLNASHAQPIMMALWFTTLVSMVVVNRQLVQRNADNVLFSANGQPPMKDQLLLGFHVKTSRITMAWQLRYSRVAISLCFLMLASFLGESWPLELNTTIAGLLLFALIVGFQLQPRPEILEERRSLPHVAALLFSAALTSLAVSLNRYGLLVDLVSDPRSDWKVGTWSALVSHQVLVAVIIRLRGKAWFRRRNREEEPPAPALQNEEKSTTQGQGEKQILET